MKPFKLVVFKAEDSDFWNAQCLEVDIGAQAKTVEDVLYELQRALIGHVFLSKKLGVEPFENIPQAPEKIWELWKRASINMEFRQ